MIIDRGFIMVEPKLEYIKWIKKYAKETPIDFEDLEPSIYLISDDFLDDELVINRNYEEIFLYELEISGIEEDLWPEIDFENFIRFFKTIVGVSVVDLKQK